LKDRLVVAGIDISLNTENNQVVGLQLHLYLLIEGKNTLALQEAVKAAFPPEPTAPRPYDFKEVHDPSGCITYLFKSVFYRRSRYRNPQGHAETRAQALKGKELVELMMWLNRFPIPARLVLRGVRRNGHAYVLTK
jgi:hypothetical protein